MTTALLCLLGVCPGCTSGGGSSGGEKSWVEPKPCVDADQDGFGANCLLGPDCDDHDPNNYWVCSACADHDGDGWYLNCDRYLTILGGDCDDDDPNNWQSCSSCRDSDHDGYFTGCDAYLTIAGLDCDNNDPNNWASCGTCVDEDNDHWFVGCDAYGTIHGPDCSDHDPNNRTTCATCGDGDGDSWFAGCDVYATLPGPDCDDGDSATHPGGFDICDDNIDQDCDGYSRESIWTDDGTDFRLTVNDRESTAPSLQWTGSEFGIAWYELYGGDYVILFTRVTPDGQRAGTNLEVNPDAVSTSYPSLVWTGSEFGVAWHDMRDGNYEIYFARILAGGAKIGGDLRISFDGAKSTNPIIVWTGSEYGLAWTDNRDLNNEIYLARLTDQGIPIGSDHRITYAPASSASPSLAWTGSEFGIAYSDYRGDNLEIYFSRSTAAGDTIAPECRVTFKGDESLYPSLAWSGSEFGLTWRDYDSLNSHYYIRFARISSQGAKIGNDADISYQDYPKLKWNGSEFDVVSISPNSLRNPVYFARISPLGFRIGTAQEPTVPHPLNSHDLAWTGSEFGLAWSLGLLYHESSEIYFTRIVNTGCP